MPAYVLNPQQAVPPAAVTSSDGVLTVTPRADFGAAAVKVDFARLAGTSTARTVLVSRQNAAVRALDRVFAPRGVVVGWDQEFTLNVSTTWTARCYDAAGMLVATSATATMGLPRQRLGMWVKSVAFPAMATAFVGDPMVKWAYGIKQAVQWPIGGRYASTASDVRQAGTGTLTLHSLDVQQLRRMRDLLRNGGPTYLLQSHDAGAVNGAEDVYVVIGPATENPLVGTDAYRSWDLPVTQVERPSTAGWTLPIPGLTLGEQPAVALSTLSGRLVDYPGV